MNEIVLSVVVPGYNESGIVEENIKKIHITLNDLGIPAEIIFVNDGSTDDTGEIVRRLAEQIETLNLVTYSENAGRGYALRQGIDQATGKFVLTTESDLNYGERVIRDLYEAIRNSNHDIVVASPYMKGGKTKNLPPKRLFLSKWGNKILSASIGNIVHTISGMTRIYRRESIQSMLLVSNDKEIHLEILSKALALGYRVTEIPATLVWPEKKIQKTGKRKSLFSTLKYVNSHIVFTLFERPILLFGVLGMLILISGVIIGGYIAYLRLTGALNPTRPLMSIMILMVLGGIIIISFGIIGMHIRELHKEILRMRSELKNHIESQ